MNQVWSKSFQNFHLYLCLQFPSGVRSSFSRRKVSVLFFDTSNLPNWSLKFFIIWIILSIYDSRWVFSKSSISERETIVDVRIDQTHTTTLLEYKTLTGSSCDSFIVARFDSNQISKLAKFHTVIRWYKIAIGDYICIDFV